jgi:hypothetical protein
MPCIADCALFRVYAVITGSPLSAGVRSPEVAAMVDRLDRLESLLTRALSGDSNYSSSPATSSTAAIPARSATPPGLPAYPKLSRTQGLVSGTTAAASGSDLSAAAINAADLTRQWNSAVTRMRTPSESSLGGSSDVDSSTNDGSLAVASGPQSFSGPEFPAAAFAAAAAASKRNGVKVGGSVSEASAVPETPEERSFSPVQNPFAPILQRLGTEDRPGETSGEHSPVFENLATATEASVSGGTEQVTEGEETTSHRTSTGDRQTSDGNLFTFSDDGAETSVGEGDLNAVGESQEEGTNAQQTDAVAANPADLQAAHIVTAESADQSSVQEASPAPLKAEVHEKEANDVAVDTPSDYDPLFDAFQRPATGLVKLDESSDDSEQHSDELSHSDSSDEGMDLPTPLRPLGDQHAGSPSHDPVSPTLPNGSAKDSAAVFQPIKHDAHATKTSSAASPPAQDEQAAATSPPYSPAEDAPNGVNMHEMGSQSTDSYFSESHMDDAAEGEVLNGNGYTSAADAHRSPPTAPPAPGSASRRNTIPLHPLLDPRSPASPSVADLIDRFSSPVVARSTDRESRRMSRRRQSNDL